MDINEILQLAVDKHASDIFIVAGTTLAFKIGGIIQPIGMKNLHQRTQEHTLKKSIVCLMV